MMNEAQRKRALDRRRPDKKWPGEAMLGGWYTDREIDTVVETIRNSMDWTVGFGFICDEIVDFENAFADYCDTEHAVSITSAGAGLEMAMMSLDLREGDEVISPVLNFAAADYAILGQGAQLVHCRVDPKTMCADPADVEERMTENTRAINVTHMNGLSADMDALLDIAQRNPHPEYGPPKVIGDAARACGGEYNGTKIGKKGWQTVFSFHTMKLMTTLGEGGMITTDDPDLYERLKGIRMWGSGTDDWGANYKMTKVQAAVGLVQLDRLDEMNAARYELGQQRNELLQGTPGLTLPNEPDGYKHTYYLYTCLVPDEWAGEKRDRVINILEDEYGIGAIIANPPTYQGRGYISNNTTARFPEMEHLAARIFCPSIHPVMSEEDNAYVAAAIIETMERVREDG